MKSPSFKIKVAGLVLFSVLLPFVIFHLVSLQQFSQSLEQALGQELNAKATLVAKDVDRFIAQRETDTRVLAHSESLNSPDINAVGVYLRSVADASAGIDEIDLLDRFGTLICHSGDVADCGSPVLDNYAISPEIWSELLQAVDGEVFVLQTEFLDTGEGPGILFLTPVVRPAGGPATRFLLLEVNLIEINAIIDDFAASLQGHKHVYLVTNEGRVIATDNRDLAPFELFPDIHKHPQTLEFFSEPGASGTFSYTDSAGDRVMAGYADMAEYGVNLALDWSILATAATEEIMAPAQKIRQLLLLLGLMLAGVMMIFAYLVARSLTTPVEKTIAAARRLEQGDYAYRLSPQGSRESRTLAIAFNQMADRISRHTRDLADTNQQLETQITERRVIEKQAWHQANYDALTGLPNRSLFNDRLHQVIAQAQRSGDSFFILFLDLDRFKGINDTLGHNVGDRFLKAIAERILACFREDDTVARLGGDEFVIQLSPLKSERDITRLLRRLLETVSQPVFLDNRECFSTVSIGVAQFPQDGNDSESLLRNADVAMYAAKDRGKNTYHFFTADLNAKAVENLELENHLRRALEKQEIFLVYQPQLDLKCNRVTGVEALLRWQHPKLGVISPDAFIPLAEETGLILPIGEWVLRTACTQAMAWQEAGLAPLVMAVNISGRQFQKPNFTDMVTTILKDVGLDPAFLELEITESIAAHNVQQTLMTIVDLKARGFRLSIDDFGTGYSSLASLKNLPIDRVKIAQEFVRDIPGQQDDVAIVETIIAMAHSLGLEVIAEGVETREQLEFLSKRGCSNIQGYYFARPVPPEQIPQVLNGEMPQV